MAQLFVTLWRDIPSQITAQIGRKRAKQLLPDRFQEAIDTAAMRAKLTGTDAYIEQWRRYTAPECGDDLEAEAQALAEKVIAYYDGARLRALTQNGGVGQGDADIQELLGE